MSREIFYSYFAGLVAVAAFGCMAVMNANDVWARAVGTVSLLALFYSIIAAVYCRDVQRAFWLGFAVFGWGYVLLQDGVIGKRFNDFATAIPVNYLAEALQDRWKLEDIEMPDGQRISRRTNRYIVWIGHSLCTLVFALIGGLLDAVTKLRSAS